MKSLLAQWACKLTKKGLRMLNRGGTAFPGSVALKIDPEVLSSASKGVRTIIVTGTNGKTTTSLMIAKGMEKAGYDYFANGTGANLLNGITSAFIHNTDMMGKPLKKFAVIECDEASLKYVAPLVKPEVVVVTNLFRDQLDRYGEVMTTLSKIREALVMVQDSVLCLNGDCSLTSSLGDLPNRTYFFGMSEDFAEHDENELSDAPRCIKCSDAYEYDYRTYGHLGSFRCPKCGYSRPQLDVYLSHMIEMNSRHTDMDVHIIDHDTKVRVALPAVYNAYNALAAICAFKGAGLSEEAVINSLMHMRSAFGRMENFTMGKSTAQMILVKNPAGCNQTLDYLKTLEKRYTLILILNDGYADGKDISWIWDSNYEKLVGNEMIEEVVVSGDRRDDMMIRIKYAGFDMNKVRECVTTTELVDVIRHSGKAVILPNYTAMLQMRHVVAEATGAKQFWEE